MAKNTKTPKLKRQHYITIILSSLAVLVFTVDIIFAPLGDRSVRRDRIDLAFLSAGIYFIYRDAKRLK
jgi:hypothetical protein